MNQYQFESIARTLARQFGKIPHMTEGDYAMVLFPLESNALKIWRHYPDSNGPAMEEAILLVLHELNGRLTGTKPDTAKFETPANTRLRHVLLSAFDPETSEEIRDGLKEHHVDLEDPSWAKAYYVEYIVCLLRILESVQNLTKQMGSNGYFTFLESFIGDKVKDNLSLNHTVAIPVFD